MAFSSVPNSPEEGRAFLQQRLALFGRLVFILYGAFATFSMATIMLVVPGTYAKMRMPPYHLAGVLQIGVLWLICRRGERSQRVLDAIDVAAVVIVGVSISFAIRVAAAEFWPEVVSTLAATHLVLGRAIIVPSPWRRTLVISAIGVLPTALLIIHDVVTGVSAVHVLMVFMLPAWLVMATVMASVTSHILYALRQRVVEARQLGQYTLEAKIGEGGMGIVHRARHAMLRRPTVVKLLPQERAGSANVARFEREVQLTSQLSSPNTVAIYDFGRTPDGIFYYAMEYLDGVDLEKLVLRKGTQPAGRVVHVLAQACSALTEAHERGLIHRDIKPGNIMLCRHGGAVDVVKVLDFGLVKDVGISADLRLTQADALLGTPLYLSPEAIVEPDRVDGRSDLYALGAVGYFLLTGKPVFGGRTVAEVSAHHLHTPPAPLSSLLALPADLEALLLSCLQKDPAARPASARALRTALLACGAAGSWTEEDAKAWWDAHGDEVEPMSGEMRTVA